MLELTLIPKSEPNAPKLPDRLIEVLCRLLEEEK